MEWLGGVLGGSWGNLGASWVLLEPFWASWRDLWGILGGTWGILEGFWSVLGGSWGVLGRPWRLPGTILEIFFKDFLASQAIYENSEKHRKTNGFSLIFEVLEGFYIGKKSKSEVQERFFSSSNVKNLIFRAKLDF